MKPVEPVPWDHPDADPLGDMKRALDPLPENPILREAAKRLFPFWEDDE